MQGLACGVMTGFTARGGWWVAAQGALVAAYGAALVLGGAATHELWIRVGLLVPAAPMLAAAAWLAMGGLRALGPHLTPYPEPRPSSELVERGVYAVVRHPLYGAVVLGAAGVALVTASAWAGLVMPVLLPFFYAKAVFEERRLTAVYSGYEAYRRKVRWRLIPGVL